MLSIVTDVEQTKGVRATNELKWAMKKVPPIENETREKWLKVQICLVIRKNTGVKGQESVLSL